MRNSKLQLADHLIDIFKRAIGAEMPTRVLLFPRGETGKRKSPPGERSDWGAHPVVLLAVERPVTLRAGGHDGISLRVGDALLLSARDLLELKAGGEGALVGMETLGTVPCRFISMDAADPLGSRRDVEFSCTSLAYDLPTCWKASHEAYSLLESALRHGKESSNLAEPALRSVLKLAAIEGEKVLGIFRHYIGAPIEKSNFARVSAAEAFVSFNIDRDIRKSELADHLGVSVSQLTLAFREIGQLAVRDRIRFRRVECARNLLADTGLSVAEVADRVGMNYRHFIRAFRQNAGITPLRFRKHARRSLKTPDIWDEFLHTENFARVQPLASLNGEADMPASAGSDETVTVLFSNASASTAVVSRLAENGEFIDLGVASAEKRLSFFDRPGSLWKIEARDDSETSPLYFKLGETNSHFVFSSAVAT